MERTENNNWQDSQSPNGTPKGKNNAIEEFPKETFEKEFQEETIKTESLKIYPSGVIVNEVLPSPEGPDAEEEWIELFNQNSFIIDLSDWKITDITGSTNVYTFPKETLINAKQYLLLQRPTTNITLNNSGDGIKLIQPNGNIVNSVNYEKAPRGESFSFINEWVWNTNLTPGSKNALPAQQEQGILKETDSSEKGLTAAINPFSEPKKENQNTKSFTIYLVALFCAIFSGIIIILLKQRLKSN